ncbi:uncharacterized protein MELLADRAFT_116589 [Melampsora larici-populina 98AG31]|uniref:BTB domain-containing protein n=1 Tax=Melampsora larici-populina (strain 98AG31 / pathotype 3-4-7) TaxID=747676 RepID=F4RMX5_MELLP|nr:uncharacterized protein MELLADRAFT_116589 [Melampsora larici-populina 98AG31]EGG06191.1 hypothetical protein MELLADRAFT_116589 [Melampsora larici-populina 98AG31]
MAHNHPLHGLPGLPAHALITPSKLQAKLSGPIAEYVVDGLAKDIKEQSQRGNYRWVHNITNPNRHDILGVVSIYTVQVPGSGDTLKLEVAPHPTHTQHQPAHYAQPTVTWRMNIGTTSSPGAFLDTSRVFTKGRAAQSKTIVDLGTIKRFTDILEQTKDVLVLTIYVRNVQDPDISGLLKERREHRHLVSNLGTLLGIHSRLFNDPCLETVRFVFPQRSGRRKYLYALETVLRSVKYFANLLDSQFAETNCNSSDYSPSKPKKAKLDHPSPSPSSQALEPLTSTALVHLDPSLDPTIESDESTDGDSHGWWNGDSDDEADDPDHDLEEYEMPAERFKATIVVTDTPYPTYRALLTYMFSGSIRFAPLRSTYVNEKRAARKRGEDFESWKSFVDNRSTSITMAECDLIPTSPKSMYILADKLIMPELQKLCRQQIIKSLTPSNIFNEIKTDMCVQYTELRSGYAKYLQENLTAAMSSDTLQEILISALSPAGRETADLLRDVFQKPPTPIPTTSGSHEAPVLASHIMDHPHDHWALHHDSGFDMGGLDGEDDNDLFSDDADSLDYV